MWERETRACDTRLLISNARPAAPFDIEMQRSIQYVAVLWALRFSALLDGAALGMEIARLRHTRNTLLRVRRRDAR